jgi:hypothetical protein
MSSRIQRTPLMPAYLPAITTMPPFSLSLWTVDLLLERRRELSPTSVSMLRESLLPSLFFSFFANDLAFLLTWLRAFRSSTEEAFASQGERDRFLLRPRDSTLEHTADSQEKGAGDVAVKASPLKKKAPEPEPDFILVSSSGEPSGSKHHVSLNIACHPYLPISSPRG